MTIESRDWPADKQLTNSSLNFYQELQEYSFYDKNQDSFDFTNAISKLTNTLSNSSSFVEEGLVPEKLSVTQVRVGYGSFYHNNATGSNIFDQPFGDANSSRSFKSTTYNDNSLVNVGRITAEAVQTTTAGNIFVSNKVLNNTVSDSLYGSITSTPEVLLATDESGSTITAKTISTVTGKNITCSTVTAEGLNVIVNYMADTSLSWAASSTPITATISGNRLTATTSPFILGHTGLWIYVGAVKRTISKYIDVNTVELDHVVDLSGSQACKLLLTGESVLPSSGTRYDIVGIRKRIFQNYSKINTISEGGIETPSEKVSRYNVAPQLVIVDDIGFDPSDTLSSDNLASLKTKLSDIIPLAVVTVDSSTGITRMNTTSLLIQRFKKRKLYENNLIFNGSFENWYSSVAGNATLNQLSGFSGDVGTPVWKCFGTSTKVKNIASAYNSGTALDVTRGGVEAKTLYFESTLGDLGLLPGDTVIFSALVKSSVGSTIICSIDGRLSVTDLSTQPAGANLIRLVNSNITTGATNFERMTCIVSIPLIYSNSTVNKNTYLSFVLNVLGTGVVTTDEWTAVKYGSLSGSQPSYLQDTSKTQFISGDVVIGGNVYVQGTTSQFNVETVTTQDKSLTLNKNGISALGAGIDVEVSGVTSKSWKIDSSGNWTTNGEGITLPATATLTIPLAGTLNAFGNSNFKTISLEGLTAASTSIALNSSLVLGAGNTLNIPVGAKISSLATTVGDVSFAHLTATNIDGSTTFNGSVTVATGNGLTLAGTTYKTFDASANKVAINATVNPSGEVLQVNGNMSAGNIKFETNNISPISGNLNLISLSTGNINIGSNNAGSIIIGKSDYTGNINLNGVLTINGSPYGTVDISPPNIYASNSVNVGTGTNKGSFTKNISNDGGNLTNIENITGISSVGTAPVRPLVISSGNSRDSVIVRNSIAGPQLELTAGVINLKVADGFGETINIGSNSCTINIGGAASGDKTVNLNGIVKLYGAGTTNGPYLEAPSADLILKSNGSTLATFKTTQNIDIGVVSKLTKVLGDFQNVGTLTSAGLANLNGGSDIGATDKVHIESGVVRSTTGDLNITATEADHSVVVEGINFQNNVITLPNSGSILKASGAVVSIGAPNTGKIDSVYASNSILDNLTVPKIDMSGARVEFNGSFDTDISGWSIVNSAGTAQLKHSSQQLGVQGLTGAVGDIHVAVLTSPLTINMGVSYRVRWTVVSGWSTAKVYIGTAVFPNTGYNSYYDSTGITHTGVYEQNITATNSSLYIHVGTTGTFTTTYDNIEVLQPLTLAVISENNTLNGLNSSGPLYLGGSNFGGIGSLDGNPISGLRASNVTVAHAGSLTTNSGLFGVFSGSSTNRLYYYESSTYFISSPGSETETIDFDAYGIFANASTHTPHILSIYAWEVDNSTGVQVSGSMNIGCAVQLIRRHPTASTTTSITVQTSASVASGGYHYRLYMVLLGQSAI